jgi:3-phenylpropionate/cinnamic acid dioxygenase small subunit
MSSIDLLEVIDTVYRFAAAIDHRDWQAYRNIFTDEITIDYSSYRPGSIGPMSADEWVARGTRLFPGLDVSQHTISNPRVTQADDSATCESYVRADHALDGELYTIGGHYVHGMVRRTDGWRIYHVTLRVAWSQGDRDLLTRAAARVVGSRS